jgi:hypothetical protein
MRLARPLSPAEGLREREAPATQSLELFDFALDRAMVRARLSILRQAGLSLRDDQTALKGRISFETGRYVTPAFEQLWRPRW